MLLPIMFAGAFSAKMQFNGIHSDERSSQGSCYGLGSRQRRRTEVHRLTIFVLVTLLVASSSVSLAKQRKTIHKPAYGSATTVEPTLLPEAARLKEMQKYWPNEPLCDEGGYRIRPCYMSPGRR
jgi:hypothetical protein